MIKTRLSIAILSATLALTGCIGDDESEQAVTETYVGFDPIVASADNAHLPAAQQRSPVIPFPFDALFVGAKTPTLNIPNSGNLAFVANANMQDGFSTTASWFIDIFGYVDMATVPANLIILNSATGALLVYGTDFTIESSTVKDIKNPETLDEVKNNPVAAINKQRTRLLIEPLKPLAPSTTYVVALKKGIKTTNGGMVQPSYMFNFLNSDVKIADRTDSYLNRFSAVEKATLDSLRSQLVRPIVKKLAAFGITDVLLAYSITTQSTTKTLEKVAAATVASDIAAFATGKTPHDFNAALPTNADVYVGTLKVPYYGDTPAVATTTNKAPILSSYWKADRSIFEENTPFVGSPIDGCKSYSYLKENTSIAMSTTTCFPMPLHKAENDQTIPMLITVPKGVRPDGGWPVVIFQHGITGNRTNMLAIAPTFAQAGFVTVAIDLPLHGIAPAAVEANPLYKNQIFTTVIPSLVTNERTFDVDSVGEYHGAYDKVGNDPSDPVANKNTMGRVVASSGSFFINLPSPITSRDNLRQGAADILVLAKSLSKLDLDHNGIFDDIDATKIRFSGISLGAIVGTVALGADKSATPLIGAASLSVGSGGIVKMLDGSKSYGPVIANGLAANKVFEDTDSYETFMRFAQTLADAGDPVNFAMAAKMHRPIQFTQVLNDLVVSNQSLKGATTATQDFMGATGFLSGNTALAKIMGFSSKTDIEMDTLAKGDLFGSTWLQFNQGSHSSLLDPTSNAGVTVEMQCQTAYFLKSSLMPTPEEPVKVSVGCSKPADVVAVESP